MHIKRSIYLYPLSLLGALGKCSKPLLLRGLIYETDLLVFPSQDFFKSINRLILNRGHLSGVIYATPLKSIDDEWDFERKSFIFY
jgi:hypothetical protein